MRRLETFDWWPELLAHKDTLSLRELAEKFSVTPGAISAALKRQGVSRRPAPPGPRSHRRRMHVDGAFGVDGSVLEIPSPLIRPGSKDELIHRHADILGAVPDREVAERAGVSVRTVASYRSRHGISAYKGPRQGRTRRSRIDPFSHLVGNLPDRMVADRAGVSVNAVRNYRVKRGIETSNRESAIVSDHDGASTLPGSGRQAWRVTIRVGDEEFGRVIIASDLIDAAASATSALEEGAEGELVGVTWVGELF